MRAGLRVAGIEIEVRAARGPLEAVLLDRYAPFLGAVVDPACRIAFEPNGEVTSAPSPSMAAVERGADGAVRVAHADFDAELDGGGAGRVATSADPRAVDHFLRVLLALLAPRHDALMLHACGVISGGRADVFAGRPGAGKSTLAALADGRPLLSDEHVVVRRAGTAWQACSTPFWGGFAPPGPAREAPLRHLWELRPWPQLKAHALTRGETLRVLLEHAVLPGPDAASLRAAFDVAAELAAAVAGAELCFTPSPAVWDLVDERSVA